MEQQAGMKYVAPSTCRLADCLTYNPALYKFALVPTTDKLFSVKVALWCMWQRAKEKTGGRLLALLGRDAWFFEVCARIEGHTNTVFHPEISTLVSTVVPPGTHPYADAVLVDTGYRGTVAKRMGIKDYLLMSCWTETDKPTKQLFQHGELSTEGLPGLIEGSPKLWGCGSVERDTFTDQPVKIVQDFLRQPDQFAQGILTTKIFADVLLDPQVAKHGQALLADLQKKEKQ